jgi:hypothetical protein
VGIYRDVNRNAGQKSNDSIKPARWKEATRLSNQVSEERPARMPSEKNMAAIKQP